MSHDAPVTVPPPRGRDTRARRLAREHLVKVLWDEAGRRRLPTDRALTEALARCTKDDVWWVCETNSVGPLYFLPTRAWMRALARLVRALGVRKMLEVAAGDGFVSAQLARLVPELRVIATDSGGWATPRGRMTDSDRRAFAGVPLAGIRAAPSVERCAATTAVSKYRPDLTLVVWAPPGTLVDRVIRAPTRYVLDISVDGDVCGNGARTWRFEKEFLSGAIEERGLCRLDHDVTTARATRATLYYGARDRRFGVTRMASAYRATGMGASVSAEPSAR